MADNLDITPVAHETQTRAKPFFIRKIQGQSNAGCAGYK